MSKQLLHNRVHYTFDSPFKPRQVADRIRSIRETGISTHVDDSRQYEMPFSIKHQHKGFSEINITGTISQNEKENSRLDFQCEILTTIPNTRRNYVLSAAVAVLVALGAFQLGQWLLPNPIDTTNTVVFILGASLLGFGVLAIAWLTYLSLVPDTVGKVRWYGEQTLGRLVENLLELKQDEKIIDISRLRTTELNPNALKDYEERMARKNQAKNESG